MKYYTNKRRRRIHFDYSSNALYFVTMNTWERKNVFATIKNDKLVLTELGMEVSRSWEEIPSHYPNVVLHAFAVMPDHFHGLLELRNNPSPNVGSFRFTDSNTEGASPHRHILSNIIKGFKTGATQWAMKNKGITRLWQRSFHDQISRDEQHYVNVKAYIQNNPAVYLARHRKCRW